MFLSPAVRSSLPLVAGLAVASVVLLLDARPVSAQQYQRLPVIAKGYQIAQITQRNVQVAQQAQERSRPTRPETYEIVHEATPASQPRVVTFTGPNGETRTFVLEGSVHVAQPRQVVVRLTSK